MQICSVSGASSAHQALVLPNSDRALQLTSRAWGTKLLPTWRKAELVVAPRTERLATADISSLYLPGILVANKRASLVLQHSLIEFLPVAVNGSPAAILNPQFTVHRFRDAGAKVVRAAATILAIQAADLYLEDIPPQPAAFWLHDGNFPRFLFCTEPFVQQVRAARLSGLTFVPIGRAAGDA